MNAAPRKPRLAPNHPHTFEVEALLQELDVPVGGLSCDEALRRLGEFGPNSLPEGAPRSPWRALWEQFASVVVALLAVAALLAALRGDPIEAAAIVVVLVLNAAVGFATEWNAEGALRTLRRSSPTRARARRDGEERLVEAADLVPGDLVLLSPGDAVPADARLVEAVFVRVQESALTGESEPVDKAIEPLGAVTPLPERRNMVYQGTSLVAGQAVALVVATGSATELGRIGRLLALTEAEETPLRRKLETLGRPLVAIVLGLAALVFTLGLARGEPVGEMAEVAISLAVAAVPEGLPTVTTLVLALGVLRMARRKAIVRRLCAVETLGGTTVIATDKTGTLTQNRMSLRAVGLPDGRIVAPADEEAREILRGGCLCNDAASSNLGDPTETALLEAVERSGLETGAMRETCPRIKTVPFDTATRRMATLHESPDGGFVAYTKGAPGAVMPRCVGLDFEARRRLVELERRMAEGALRVLALASKRCERDDDLEEGYRFLGLVGLLDPPRPEVPDAVRRAREAGIRVIMLTGDGAGTAQAIADEIGLAGDEPSTVVHASEVAEMDEAALAERLRTATAFARVSPEEKLRIVQALRDAGEIVAVTGDGVNDAPALKRADVAVAMGERGTEVAKEAADVVLTDDNFATIVVAIEEGRAIGANVRKFVHFLFATNLVEVLLLIATTALGLPLPLSPLAIVWINLVTDVFPALALAVEPPEGDIMRRSPTDPKAPLLSRGLVATIIGEGVLLASAVFGAYLWALHAYGEGEHARTVALLSTVGVEIALLFWIRGERVSLFGGISRSPAVAAAALLTLGLQLLAVYSPLGRVLSVSPPQLADWIAVASVAITTLSFRAAAGLLSSRGS